MNDNTTLAHQMVATAPVAARNARKPAEAEGFVGMDQVAQGILGQPAIRACVPFLINRYNVL